MRLKEERLMQMLGIAFDCGLEGSYEFKEQTIQEIIEEARKIESNNWAVFTIEELKSLLVGVKIYHPQLGEGRIHMRFDGVKVVKFSKVVAALDEDNWPWNEPIRIISD